MKFIDLFLRKNRNLHHAKKKKKKSSEIKEQIEYNLSIKILIENLFLND